MIELRAGAAKPAAAAALPELSELNDATLLPSVPAPVALATAAER